MSGPRSNAASITRLLLVGAGHAHLEVLRRLARQPLAGVELAVVSPATRHHYSGMVPGFHAGMYREEEIAVELPPLVERAGGRLLLGRAVGLDPRRRRVRVAVSADRIEEIGYDLAAFAIGSNTAGIERPEVGAHAHPAKPIGRLVELRARVLTLAGQSSGLEIHAAAAAAAEPGGAGSARGGVVVVGGGAGGIEVAFAVAAIAARQGASLPVQVLESGADILAGISERFRRRARRVLAARGIEVRTGARVAAVEPDAVVLADGSRIAARLTVWLTGAVAWPVFAGAGLPLDQRGFLLTDDALRSTADPRVFAAGDCGTLARHPATPKAGVYAVREGPLLWRSLVAAIDGGKPPRYRPQADFLSILNTCDGRALLRYKGFVSYSRWAWRLKNAIDRRFVARYRPAAEK